MHVHVSAFRLSFEPVQCPNSSSYFVWGWFYFWKLSLILYCPGHLGYTFPRLHFRPVLEYKFVKEARREQSLVIYWCSPCGPSGGANGMCLKPRYFSSSRFFYGHSSSTDGLYVVIPRYLISFSKDLGSTLKSSDTRKRKVLRPGISVWEAQGLSICTSPLQSALVPVFAFLQMVPPFTPESGIRPCSSPRLYSPHPILLLSPSPLHSHGLCLWPGLPSLAWTSAIIEIQLVSLSSPTSTRLPQWNLPKSQI